MSVVVLIRHPAAFAGSLKRLDWQYPFEHLVGQELLRERYFSQFDDEIHQQARTKHDIVDQSILLWRLIHHVIAVYQTRHPDWLFVRHEDLSRDPVTQFQRLHDFLSLDFSAPAREYLARTSNTRNPAEAPTGGDSLHRDSLANITTWKHRLTPAEIRRIREGTAAEAAPFYDDSDW